MSETIASAAAFDDLLHVNIAFPLASEPLAGSQSEG
jgi:hypothetical protein